MKKLTLIVHADVKQALADTLRGFKQVQGFTFTSVEGHGAHTGEDTLLSVRDRVVGYVLHVRMDILLKDEDADDVLRALRTAGSGVARRGVYWVTPVDEFGQL